MVPPALRRFIAWPSAGSSVDRVLVAFGRRHLVGTRLAAAVRLALGLLQLLEIGGAEIDAVEQQRREAAILGRVADDLTGEREKEARRFDEEEGPKGFFREVAQADQPDRARVATQILRRNSGRLDVVYPKDTKDDADTPWEEVVMNIQGYIVEKNLPPIVRPEQSVTH